MSAASPPALRTLLNDVEQLFQKERRALTEHLNQSVRRLRQCTGFAEVAGILTHAAAPFCTACAIFRIDQDQLIGEQATFSTANAAAFAGAIETREPVVALCSPNEVSPALIELFHHAADDKAYLFPLTAGPATAGILYAYGKVESAAIELLTQSAAAVLEARQRPAQSPTLVRIAGASKSSPAPWESLSIADRNLHLKAQRFARVHVAEMRLYQEDAVKAGRAGRDLYLALQEPIDAGREEFRKHFITASATMVDYFHQELVRTLANDDAAALGENYPGPLV